MSRSDQFSLLTESWGMPMPDIEKEMIFRRYSFLAEMAAGKHLLEVGCGAGLGNHLLDGQVDVLCSFDLEKANIDNAVAHAPGARLQGVLVQKMAARGHELVVGVVTDPDFGPLVMLGLGGVTAEALGDVVFRVAPLSLADALDMMDELRGRRILGPFRGEPAVDRQALAQLLVDLGRLGLADPRVAEVDLNPLKFSQGRESCYSI